MWLSAEAGGEGERSETKRVEDGGARRRGFGFKGS